ncbi:MAG: hypothetical protein KKH98_04260 [Spirochaetes bacterium]|nr:hypothetical protein [Spirochaetota bacterium]
MMKRSVILIAVLFLLHSCGGKDLVVKKNYRFDKIKKVLVLQFSDFNGQQNSGNIISDLISYKMLKLQFDVMSRELVNKNEKFEAIIEKAKNLNVDALITGSITKYSLEKKIHKVKKNEKAISVKGENTGEVNITEEENELIYSSGRIYGANTELPYEVEATVGLIAKMIDVKTGETIWINKAQSSGFSIEAAVESAVDSLYESFVE